MEPIARVRAYYEAFIAGDIPRAESFFAADRLVAREAESLPYGGAYEGVEGFRTLLGKLGATWKRVRFEGLVLAAAGDTVFARFRFTAISRATGTETSFPVVEVFRVGADGITEIDAHYWDTHAVRRVLGID